MTNDMRDALAAARATIEEQNKFIEQVTAQPSPYAVVAFIGDEKTVIVNSGALLEVELPQFPIEVGMTVVVAPQTGQIVRASATEFHGSVVLVSKVRSETGVEYSSESSGTKLAFKAASLELEEGDRVLVDPTGTVVIRLVEKASSKMTRSALRVEWDDIGGLADVKDSLREIIELPYQNPEIFARYGYTPPRGVLLAGPPGCGKTMLGKAVATSLAGQHGAEAGFFYVKGPEVLNKFVGESESNVRAMFDQARAHKKKTGVPGVIFIDEAEALLSRRGSGISADMEKTIVPTFLAEMDGIEESGAVVILATNRPEQLDPAVIRDGRVDRKVTVSRPDKAAIYEIAYINLSQKPLGRDSVRDMSVSVVEQFGRQVIDGRLIDYVSGAMVVNVVSRATSIALHRDLREKTSTGITVADICAAGEQLAAEHAVAAAHHGVEKNFSSRTQALAA